MKRAAVLLIVLAAAGAPLAAQTPSEPHLVFSITGGLTMNGSLWSVQDQPLAVLGTSPTAFDTLSLVERRLRPGIVAGLAGSYFRSRTFGWTAEVMYFGIASEQRCSGPAAYDTTDAEQINRQACDRANGEHVATSVVGFLGGATFRFLPDGVLEPFLRFTVGPGLIGNSYIETTGIIRSTRCGTADNLCVYPIYLDPEKPQLTFVANVSGGITIKLSQAYRARFEVRDIITQLPTVVDKPPPNSIEPVTGMSFKHVPTITMGLDITLERRHTRRY